MSGAVWRAALGTLRANRRSAYYYLLASVYLAQTCAMALRRPGVIPILLLAFWCAFGWPLFLRNAPAHRDLLRLPLSTRDAGAVLFVLRVIAPSICALLVIPLLGQLIVSVPDSPLKLLSLAYGVSAAFPLFSLAPFLPLPRSWREAGVIPEDGDDRRLRWLAAAAVWVLAPAIAVLPLVSIGLGFHQWPWISLALGLGLAWLLWTHRERLARAALQSSPAPATADEKGAHWHGSSGFIPLLAPLVGTCCALGLPIGLFFTVPLLPGASSAMLITLVALSASLSARYLSGCARALRLLPISTASLGLIMLSMLVLPTLAGCLLGAILAHALHPLRLSIAHVGLSCLLCLTCDVAVFTPALRSGRLKFIGPLLAASAALQVAWVLATLHFDLAVPPDGWAFAVCLGVLGASLAWLAASLKFYRFSSLAAVAIMALLSLPVFAAPPFDAARDAAGDGSALHRDTEDALRRVIGELSAGKVDFDRIGLELAVHLRPQVGASQALLAQCGALQSVLFSGSTGPGWDIYIVQFRNATLEWRIALGADGKIMGLRFSPH